MEEKVSLLGFFRTVIEVLDRCMIVVWLDAGALLGVIRDGDFIPWDNDIDLSIYRSDAPKLLEAEKEFVSLGLKCYRDEDSLCIIGKDGSADINIIDIDGKVVRDTYVFSRDFVGDFLDYLLWVLDSRNPEIKKGKMPFFITKFLVKVFSRFNIENFKNYLREKYKNHTVSYEVEFPSRFYTNLKIIDVHGVKVWAPKDAEGFLAYKYGPDWRIPMKRTGRKGKGKTGWFLDGSSVKGTYTYKNGNKIYHGGLIRS